MSEVPLYFVHHPCEIKTEILKILEFRFAHKAAYGTRARTRIGPGDGTWTIQKFACLACGTNPWTMVRKGAWCRRQTDYSQDDSLGVWCKPVNFGAMKGLRDARAPGQRLDGKRTIHKLTFWARGTNPPTSGREGDARARGQRVGPFKSRHSGRVVQICQL